MNYSIIIPAYNSEKTIHRCLNSILNSKFNEKFELIVVDDSSTDKTAIIAKKFGAKVIKNRNRGGPSKARNIGARYAKGKILLFIDSDVLLFSNTLQLINNFLKNKKEIVALSCNFDPKCEMKDSISRYKHLYTQNNFLKQTIPPIFTSTCAIKKEVFQSIGGFNEKLRVNEDNFLGIKLTNAGYKIAFSNQILIKHLHKYSLIWFIKEEFRRSRTQIMMKFTQIKPIKTTVPSNLFYSLLLFPFLILMLFLNFVDFWLFTVGLIIFYLINFDFLRLCKKYFGVRFMLKSMLIIPLDCLSCYVGTIFGIFDFIGGKRI